MRSSGARAAVGIPSLLGVLVAHGCTVGAFACQDDAQCVNDGVAGTCQPTGGCSFPDPTCGSGQRYGAHSPDGLAGHCVSAELATVETGDVSVSVSVTITDGSLDDSGGDSSASADATTMAVSATIGSDTSSGTATSTTNAASDDSNATESTGGSPVEFLDAFDRADALDLGNGWIEKTPGAFRLLDEQVELETVNGGDFHQNLFYRPLDESLLDLEASVVVNFVADAALGFPQLHVRVQADDVDMPASLTSYAVFVGSDDPQAPVLTLAHIAGEVFGATETFAIEPLPIDAETYRLRARVTGTDPVMVEGFFEVLTDSGWEVRTEGVLLDTAEDRIVTAGTMGAGGHLQLDAFVLDDFAYVAIE